MARERFDVGRLEGPEEEYRFTAGSGEAGARLDAALSGRYRWLSRTEAKKLIAAGRVHVGHAEGGGGETAGPEVAATRASFRLAAGDRVRMVYPRSPQDGEAARVAPPEEALKILFEDDCLLAVDKPAGIPVHPVGVNVHRTVLTALHRHCRAAGVPEEDMPILPHRLDVETSGVFLAVKGKKAAAHVVAQFRERSVHKEYRALVYGGPERDEGVVELPLGPAEGSRVPYRQAVREDGAPAVTRYAVERRGTRFSLLRIVLETGRKHQIRVHLAAIGHPVVGDKVYGPDEEHYFKARSGPPSARDLEELILPRHALHSALLRLRHPRSGAETVIESPLPPDIGDALSRDAGGESRIMQ